MQTYFDYQKAIFASELSSTARLLALAIASHFHWADLNPSFPGNETLARETGLGISTITKAKRELIDSGFLSVKRRFNGSSLHTPTVPLPDSTRSTTTEHTFHYQVASNRELNKNINKKRLSTAPAGPVDDEVQGNSQLPLEPKEDLWLTKEGFFEDSNGNLLLESTPAGDRPYKTPREQAEEARLIKLCGAGGER